MKKILMIPLTMLITSLAVSVFAQAKSEEPIAKMQKRHIVARGRLDDTKAVHQIVVWQTANPSGGILPYAKAHLAIETPGKNPRTLFQTDGGKTQYIVDAIQLADLDNDGIAEIVSLWWEGASGGAVLRVFHFDKASRAFVELKSDDELSGIHRYHLSSVARPQPSRHIVVYARTDAFAGTTRTYELRGAKIVRVKKGSDKKMTDKNPQTESGIEGEAVIGPTRPHIRLNDPTPDVVPFKATLIILAATDNREITRFETGSDGLFRVTLPPGEYIVRPVGQGRMGPRAGEQNITVRKGQFTKIKINFDSGLR